MPVKHALLALLAQRDLTGYELKVRFERAVGEFWQLNSGQVYSTLERMRRAGLVSRARDGEAPERARYSVLPRGRRQLAEWLATPPSRLRPVRDGLYVKLVFHDPEHAPAVLAAIAVEARKYTQALEILNALVAREPLSYAGRTRWLVAEAARLEFEAHLRWLEHAQRLLAPAARAADPHRAPAPAAEAARTPAPRPARPLTRLPALGVSAPGRGRGALA